MTDKIVQATEPGQIVSLDDPHLVPRDKFKAMRLGRKPRSEDAHRANCVPRLARMLAESDSLPSPPAAIVRPISAWILGENDQIGDCTIVAKANAILTLTTLAGQPVRLMDDQIKAAYFRLTGGADTGLFELDVLADWRKEDAVIDSDVGDRLAGFGQLMIGHHNRIMQAIALFGGLYCGANLPITAQGQDVQWSVVSHAPAADQEPGSWGGHAFWVPEYNLTGPVAITWGQRQQMTWEWWDRYVDEAYALLDRDFLNAKGTTPDGINWDMLSRDLDTISA